MYEMRKDDSPYKGWIPTWPKLKDLQDSMPLMLQKIYRKPHVDRKTGKEFLFLPPAIGGIWINSLGNLETEYESNGSLPKQEAKMKRDMPVSGANDLKIDILSREGTVQELDLNWLWLMINSRSFYYDLPLRTKPRIKDDKLCLCPFMDYFNHDNQGVRSDSSRLEVTDLDSVKYPMISKDLASMRTGIIVSKLLASGGIVLSWRREG